MGMIRWLYLIPILTANFCDTKQEYDGDCDIFDEITDAEIDQIKKPPNWLSKAMSKMPLNANLIDVIEYIKPRQWLHKGAPFKYLTRNSHDILLQLERRRRESLKRNEGPVYAMDEIDRQELCPDQIADLVEWDYGSSEDLTVVITDRKVVLKERVDVNHIEIGQNGMLVFGEPTGDAVELRAKSVNITDQGSFWIGSRSCRYQHEGYITLYGNHTEMHDIPIIGQKYIWCSNGATCEFHGLEKKAWTYLSDHLFVDNSPVRPIAYNHAFNGLYVQRFTKYGAWKDSRKFLKVSGVNDSIEWLHANVAYCNGDFNCVDDIYVIGSTGSGIQDEAKSAIQSLLNVTLPQSGNFLLIKQGHMITFHNGDSEDISVPLTGTYSGHSMRIIVGTTNNNRKSVEYTGHTNQTIISLAENVDWRVGDQIAVGSTGFSQDETETFTIVNCISCKRNQLQLDRSASHLHFGRIDQRTGVDQRAPVMLMTRNVKIRGEVGHVCQYAKTRESQDETSINYGRDWCHFFDGSNGIDTEPASGDMHGGHVIITGGFLNVHISHIELEKMGQPQLARYPLHWHFCDDVSSAIYEDPTSFESNSIHNTFNRFITIHGTEGALVKDNAGYHTKGHGYFIEDGWERYNNITGNLGMVAHQGIVLPTDQGGKLCQDTNAGFEGQTDTSYCNALTMFWISHIQNYVDNNVAVGARVGFWFINHNTQSRFWPNLAPFTNNRASSSMRGMFMESAVEERDPKANRITAKFGKIGSRQNASPTGLSPLEGCHEVIFDGWNIHHVSLLGVWIRQSSVTWKNGQFSDNQRGFVYPTSDCPGNVQKLHDTVFVGMTENVGNPPDGISVHMASGNMNEKQNQRPVGGHGASLSWVQAPDGVYRAWPGWKWFPIRGFQAYDNYAATFVYDTQFFDYPNEWGNQWYGSAIGFLLHNQFGMVADVSSTWNLEFTNVARRVAFGSPPADGTTVPDAMKGSTPWFAEFGSTEYDLRFMADGEKNSMIYDVDGTISGTPETMLIAKENLPNIFNECFFREDFNGYQCPKNRKFIGGRSGIGVYKAYQDGSNTFNASDNYFGEIQLNSREGEQGVFYTFSMGNAVTYSFYANESYHMSMLESPPHEQTRWSPEYIDKGDWVRLSFCLQGAEPTVYEDEHYIDYRGIKSYRERPVERQSMRNVSSIDEMEAENSVPSYWWDGQWLHIKVVGEWDRSEGGWLIDDLGRNISYAPSDYNHCHKANGCLSVRWTLNNEQASGQPCGPLPQPNSLKSYVFAKFK